MQGAITWQQVAFVAGVLAAFGGLLLHYFTDRSRIRKELHSRLDRLNQIIHDNQLQAIREFASVGHLADVEGRLTKAIDTLTDEIRGMRKEFRNGSKS